MTLNVYSHVMPGMQAEAAQGVADYINGPPPEEAAQSATRLRRGNRYSPWNRELEQHIRKRQPRQSLALRSCGCGERRSRSGNRALIHPQGSRSGAAPRPNNHAANSEGVRPVLKPDNKPNQSPLQSPGSCRGAGIRRITGSSIGWQAGLVQMVCSAESASISTNIGR